MAEPGKQSRGAGAASSAAPDLSGPSGIPGKATLAGRMPTSAADIGNPWIEGRAHCRPESTAADGCFLKPDVRPLLVDAYQKLIGDAGRAYQIAITQLKFEELIRKEPEFPALLGLMVDVIVNAATDGMGLLLKTLKSDARKTASDQLDFLLSSGVGNLEPSKPSLTTLIAGVDEPAVNGIVKASFDHGKTYLKGVKPKGEKQATINYLSYLETASQIAWQHQWLDPPSTASDAELIVLFHAFKAERGHTTGLYKEAIEQKIKRYLASAASRIGRAPANPGRDVDVRTPPSWGGASMRDTKVVWVKSTNGGVKLYYYKLDAAGVQGERAMENLDVPMAEPADSNFKINTPVEDEFVETALDRHRSIWGTEPETKLLNESVIPYWRKPRSVNDLNQFVPQNNPDLRRANRDVNDLNQYVPQNNPDFKRVKERGDRDVNDLNQYVPQNNPDFVPVPRDINDLTQFVPQQPTAQPSGSAAPQTKPPEPPVVVPDALKLK